MTPSVQIKKYTVGSNLVFNSQRLEKNLSWIVSTCDAQESEKANMDWISQI